MQTTILQGNNLEVLGQLDDQSVHCVATSVPYLWKRDYHTGRWVGGNSTGQCWHIQHPKHAERWLPFKIQPLKSVDMTRLPWRWQLDQPCVLCGAVWQDKQIGLEETLDEYLDKLVAVFSQVWRVLRDDGTLWVNIGDTYSNKGKWGGATSGKHQKGLHGQSGEGAVVALQRAKHNTGKVKTKELLGVPWRLAFRLQDEGWYVRSEIIWNKKNPTPEPVKDRPSYTHEQIFLLTKRPKYYYDYFAVMEQASGNAHPRGKQHNPKMDAATKGEIRANATFETPYLVEQRNRRSVWSVANQPYQGDHFAAYPEKLVEPCILGGTSEKGCCPQCGAQWVRIVKDGDPVPTGGGASRKMARLIEEQRGEGSTRTSTVATGMVRPKISVGFRSGCKCRDEATGQPYEPIPATVLDPFAGTGTTLKVATSYGRSSIGIELNEEYVEQIRQRLNRVQMRLELAG